jgi:1-acyl-sn-glycerol-3-phosphate acyltransferase
LNCVTRDLVNYQLTNLLIFVSQEPQQKRLLHALLSFLIFDPLIYLYTVVLGSLSLLSSFVDRDGGIQHWFARTWSWLILKTVFSPVTVLGLENLPKGPAVYAANHQSAMDIPLLYVHLPMQFRIIAKVELFKYPFMGWHLTRSGQIAVDEKNVRANLRSLNRAVETVHSGMPLVVFPEGGRSADGGIKKFLSGAFYVAIKAQVPVVPVAIVGTFEVLQMNHYVIHPGPLQLVIGKPISTEGFTTRDMDAVAERVKTAIEDMYYARAKTPDPRPSGDHVTR